MGALGKVVFILFVVFMLYFIWSVKDVAGAERKMELFAVICPDKESKSAQCVVRSRRIPSSVTPFQCYRNGMIQLEKWMQPFPEWHILRWGCRPEGLSA